MKTMKLQWKPVDPEGRAWVDLTGQFMVIADGVPTPDGLVKLLETPGVPLQEAARWAQDIVDAEAAVAD